MCRQESEIVRTEIGHQIDRRRKAAIDRKNRPFSDVGELKPGSSLGQHDGLVFEWLAVRGPKREIAPVFSNKPDGKRNHHRCFRWLPRCYRNNLRALQDEDFARRIEAPPDRYLRGTGLAVPSHELGHVAAAGVRKAPDELLDRCGLAVVPGKVEIHAGAEFFLTD